MRLATFTTAATRELAHRALSEEVPVPITTVHSFALRILVHNPQWSRLPMPLRIPDEWETKELVQSDLRGRLAVHRLGLRRTTIARLERELAAQWEAMDDSYLIADIAPELRDAYIAAWRKQRTVFGYSLFAEMPWYALDLVEDHPDAYLMGTEFLMVDEYQDLNRCETRLLVALADQGLGILSVGDEDQSIYSWRMAAPEGIRDFGDDFAPRSEYSLSVSQRCARTILAAAQRVISVAPGRPTDRPRLRPAEHNVEGIFEYLRFPSGSAERRAVVQLLHHHHEQDGVPYDRMAILTRADYQQRWSRPMRRELDSAQIPYTDIESAIAPLHTDDARELLAVARLALEPHDDLRSTVRSSSHERR